MSDPSTTSSPEAKNEEIFDTYDRLFELSRSSVEEEDDSQFDTIDDILSGDYNTPIVYQQIKYYTSRTRNPWSTFPNNSKFCRGQEYYLNVIKKNILKPIFGMASSSCFFEDSKFLILEADGQEDRDGPAIHAGNMLWHINQRILRIVNQYRFTPLIYSSGNRSLYAAFVFDDRVLNSDLNDLIPYLQCLFYRIEPDSNSLRQAIRLPGFLHQYSKPIKELGQRVIDDRYSSAVWDGHNILSDRNEIWSLLNQWQPIDYFNLVEEESITAMKDEIEEEVLSSISLYDRVNVSDVYKKFDSYIRKTQKRGVSKHHKDRRVSEPVQSTNDISVLDRYSLLSNNSSSNNVTSLNTTEDTEIRGVKYSSSELDEFDAYMQYGIPEGKSRHIVTNSRFTLYLCELYGSKEKAFEKLKELMIRGTDDTRRQADRLRYLEGCYKRFEYRPKRGGQSQKKPLLPRDYRRIKKLVHENSNTLRGMNKMKVRKFIRYMVRMIRSGKNEIGWCHLEQDLKLSLNAINNYMRLFCIFKGNEAPDIPTFRCVEEFRPPRKKVVMDDGWQDKEIVIDGRVRKWEIADEALLT